MSYTAATLMLLAGINARVVSERLRHATVAFTLDTYAHVLPSMGTEAAKVMDRLLSMATG
jgi:integrase